MTIEQQFENDLSPRAKEYFKWSANHVGGFVKPTKTPTPKHGENQRVISDKDLAELNIFTANAHKRNGR